jgi:hypothetical protein
MNRILFVLALVAGAAGLACSDNGNTASSDGGEPDAASQDSQSGTEAGPVTRTATYWQDVVPIVQNKCMGCHQAGGIAPFSMETWAETKAHAATIAAVVSAGIMPPYYIKHDGTCGNFDDSAALTAAEAQTLVAWASGGAAQGTPGQLVTPAIPSLSGGVAYQTPLFSPVAQGTDVALYDEYRCFLVDPNLPQDAFITGFEVTPGNATIVHHVIGFAVDPAAAGDTGEANAVIMQRLHDASPNRDGWPCFGGAGDSVTIAGIPVEWAPGQGVVPYPDGMGFEMKSSYRYVIQVHYNLADPQSAGQTDSSTMRVRYASAVDRKIVFFLPDGFLETLRTGKPDVLPPGQAAASYHWQKTAAQLGMPTSLPFVDLVAVGPHMHTRGIGQQLMLGTQGGPSTCESELTRWDFHWQKPYFYKPGAYPRLTPQSLVDVTCTYDTRSETAPVLPGWGTRNEMCLIGMMVALPPGV